MRKLHNLWLIACLVCLLSGCAASQPDSTEESSRGPTWQEQYDLGVRYLSDGDYEGAILAFTAAIEIDPKRAESYLGVADVYLHQGNHDKARAILLDGVNAGVFSDIQSALSALEDDQSKRGSLSEQSEWVEGERNEFEDGGYEIWRYNTKSGERERTIYTVNGAITHKQIYGESQLEEMVFNTDGTIQHRYILDELYRHILDQYYTDGKVYRECKYLYNGCGVRITTTLAGMVLTGEYTMSAADHQVFVGGSGGPNPAYITVKESDHEYAYNVEVRISAQVLEN